MKKETHNKKDSQDDKGFQDRTQEVITIAADKYNALLEFEKKFREIQEKMLRLQAEFENSKKRIEREKAEFIKYSNEQIIMELVPFVDDFKRAFQAADKTKDFDVLHKGVEMILKHLLELLKRKGVTEIEAEGKQFNPAYHEAILQLETDDYPDNTVIEELEKGYLLNDKVLRTTKVKVSKTKSDFTVEEILEKEKQNEIEEKNENESEE